MAATSRALEIRGWHPEILMLLEEVLLRVRR
jgi:hypothetical protein